jgi:carbon-monoxide dehydrogenase medium subunit
VARLVLGALDGAPRALPELAAQVARTAAPPPRAQIAAAVQTALPGKDAVDRQLIGTAVARCLQQIFPASS